MKKILVFLLAIALTAALSVSLTVAFLTDRDSETNVFTMGNVDIELLENFNQGTTVYPGVSVTKEVTIKNTGSNSAWVWYTITYDKGLHKTAGGNPVLLLDFAQESDWIVGTATELDNGTVQVPVFYNVPLSQGQTTPMSLKGVSLAPWVDVTQDGQLYYIANGIQDNIDWNLTDDGNPVIYVNAYGIQTDTFETVQEAYAGYLGQWGGLNPG